jgi:hypothetical protein
MLNVRHKNPVAKPSNPISQKEKGKDKERGKECNFAPA